MSGLFQILASIFLIFFKLVFWISTKLRLAPVLIYALLVGTVFSQWQHQNQMLAYGIFFALIGITSISWLVSLVKFLREHFALG